MVRGNANGVSVQMSSEYCLLSCLASLLSFLVDAYSKSIAVAASLAPSMYQSNRVFPISKFDMNFRLSEASKLLRRLEKGLNSAKPKQQSDSAISSPYPVSDSRTSPSGATHYSGMLRGDNYGTFDSHFPSIKLPPLNLPSSYHRNGNPPSSNGSRGTMDIDDDDDDNERGGDDMFPAKLIKRENQRHSFFRTILNPEHEPSASSTTTPTDSLHPAPLPEDLNDPISAGIIDEDEAQVIFEMVFLRLNPFINLFDPALHSVAYVRSKCPLLFSTLIMAGAKFFKPEIYKQCQKLANDLAVRAFADGWKRVEVVQAFACLTYWKEPDDDVRELDHFATHC